MSVARHIFYEPDEVTLLVPLPGVPVPLLESTKARIGMVDELVKVIRRVQRWQRLTGVDIGEWYAGCRDVRDGGWFRGVRVRTAVGKLRPRLGHCERREQS